MHEQMDVAQSIARCSLDEFVDHPSCMFRLKLWLRSEDAPMPPNFNAAPSFSEVSESSNSITIFGDHQAAGAIASSSSSIPALQHQIGAAAGAIASSSSKRGHKNRHRNRKVKQSKD
jgi:hypothetical protein